MTFREKVPGDGTIWYYEKAAVQKEMKSSRPNCSMCSQMSLTHKEKNVYLNKNDLFKRGPTSTQTKKGD